MTFRGLAHDNTVIYVRLVELAVGKESLLPIGNFKTEQNAKKFRSELKPTYQFVKSFSVLLGKFTLFNFFRKFEPKITKY